MAGGGGALSIERQKRGAASKRKKKKRIGFHLDMTPLVDITFLLLTFFMFTTTMATPQVMEMRVPPEKKEIKVDESKLMSIFVNDNGDVFWRVANDEPEKTELKNIKGIAERENLKPRVYNDLITVLKFSEDAEYGLLVKILDQLNLAEVAITNAIVSSGKLDKEGKPMKRERKFTIAPLSDEDREMLATVENKEVTE